MGHDPHSTLFFVGMARLPQPCVAAESTLAIELEVDARSRRILAANSTLPLPGLSRLLQEMLAGECLDDVRTALLELEVRYSAPFGTAICAALDRALRRAGKLAPSPDAGRNGGAVPARA